MAISITTTSNLRLYIAGDWITVAKGFPQTINFNSDATWTTIVQPTPLNLSALADTLFVHTATATGTIGITPVSESQNYNVEVITPKVVYQRLDNSDRILFIDVTRQQNGTLEKGLDWSNTFWMQNPSLNRGTITIQKYDDVLLSWTDVTTFGLNSQVMVGGLSYNPCQYRAIYRIREIPNCGGTSPIIFEAIGDTFTFQNWYYKQPSPYIESVISSNDLKYYYSQLHKALTIDSNDKTIQVDFESSNIGYLYEFNTFDFITNIPQITVSSSDKRITINFVGVYPYTLHQAIFYGLEKRFVNGILITTANPYTESTQLNIEAIKTDFLELNQLACSFDLELIDNTIVENPELETRGRIFYEIQINNQWIEIGSSPRLGKVVYSNCLNSGLYNVRSKYVVRLINNCGGTSPVVFESDYYYDNITLIPYLPNIELNVDKCCEEPLLVNQEFVIIPKEIEINGDNSICDDFEVENGFDPVEWDENWMSFDKDQNVLTYNLFYYDIDNGIWVKLSERIYSAAIESDPQLYPFKYTPTNPGYYKITSELRNCCNNDYDEQFLCVGDCITVVQDCKSCNTLNDCYRYTFRNYCNKTITVNIKLATQLDVIVQSYTVPPLSKSVTHTFTDDGLYVIEYVDNNKTISKVYPVYCKVNECYNKLLKEQLCSVNGDCCDDSYLKESRLANVQPIYQLLLNKLQDYYDKPYLTYDLIDLTNSLDKFMEVDKIKDTLLKICDKCKANCSDCFDWDKGTCI